MPVVPGRRSRWDRLDEGLQDLAAFGYHARCTEVDFELFHLIDSIITTKKPYRRLLQYRDGMAQLVINALQWFLQFHPSLDSAQKRKGMQALLRLSKRTKLLPQSFKLPDIEILDVMIETPSVDIFPGLHQGRPVCLKKYRIRRSSRSNAHREYINHRHPNLLPFKGIFQPENDLESTYLVSPFLEFGTVPEYLVTHPDVDRFLLLLDMTSGLPWLHGNNVVHGGLKGRNILVNSLGRACIADLGLSRLTDAQILTWTSIQSTVPPWGSLPWLAPELLIAQFQEQIAAPTLLAICTPLGAWRMRYSLAIFPLKFSPADVAIYRRIE